MGGDPFESIKLNNLSPEAVDCIEERVRQYAIVLGPPPPRKRISLLYGLRVAFAACITLLLLSTAIVQVSASSMPDETLYPLKRAVENVQLEFSGDQTAYKSELAQIRINEFEQMLGEGKVYPELLDDSNGYMQQVINQTDDHLLLERVERLSLYQIELIKQLVERSDFEKREDLLRIGQKTADIQSQIGEAVTPPTTPQATILIEGPIQTIGPDHIVIYGIKILLDPTGLEIGDFIVVEGDINLNSNTFIVIGTDKDRQ